MMITRHITQSFMKSLSPGSEETYADTETNGFQVWVRKKSICFYVYRKVNYKFCREKLGTWPDMTVSDARQAAMDKIASWKHPEDAPKKVVTKSDPVLKDAVDDYLQRFQDNHKQFIDNQTCLKKFENLFDKKLAEVTAMEIIQVHQDLKNTPVMANHAVKRLSTAIRQFCNSHGITMFNPCKGIAMYQETPRQRFLTDSEAPKIIEELGRLRNIARYHSQAEALLLMLYTGQRKTNVLSMRIEELNGSTWIIPAGKAKARKEILVPLNDMAMDIINGRRNEIKEGWIFPSYSRSGKTSRLKSCRHTFHIACSNVGIDDVHIHDLRRTLGSWMLMSGASIAEVSRTLGHSSIKVTEQVYAHLLPGRIRDATLTAVNAMKCGKLN